MRAFWFRVFCRVFARELTAPPCPVFMEYRYGFTADGKMVLVHPERPIIN